jgi:hypothetical protein
MSPEFSAASLLRIGLEGKNIAGFSSKKVIAMNQEKFKERSRLV